MSVQPTNTQTIPPATGNAAAPLVSVVIPVYGTERWLAECLESVLGQTLCELEAVCVNDCSPDGCAAILADFAARDPRVRVVSLERNSGQGIARNAGLDLARGTYVYFLDSDDQVEPHALEGLAARAQAQDLDGILFDSRVVFETPELARRNASYPAMRNGAYPTGAVAGIELFEAFMAQREWTCYVQRQFWRRSFLVEEKVRFQSIASHEDESFAFEAMCAARRVAYVREPYFVRRYREGSVMTSPISPKGFASYFMAYCQMIRAMDERGVDSPAAHRNLARIYEKIDRFYDALHEQHDLGALFEPGSSEAAAYRFFAETRLAHLHTQGLAAHAVEEAGRASRVLVYGAGVVARTVYGALEQAGVAIDGFAVSSPEGNPTVLRGHRVLPLEAWLERDDMADALVVVAVSRGYRAEVEAALDRCGMRHLNWEA